MTPSSTKARQKPATAEAAEASGASEETSESSRGVTIHVPGDDLGRDGKAEPVEETSAEPEPEATEEPTTAEAAEEAPKPKKKTRRGSRGGKNRKKKPATAASQNGDEATPDAEAAPEAEPASENGDFDYVPMSEWADELESKG